MKEFQINQQFYSLDENKAIEMKIPLLNISYQTIQSVEESFLCPKKLFKKIPNLRQKE